MKLVEIYYKNIHEFKNALEKFFDQNIDSSIFFHPHSFSYSGISEELKTHSLDYYVLMLDNEKIAGYGMLRGWSEGYLIPSLGIIISNEFRKKGLSAILMNHLHDIAKKRNSKKIRLTVEINNYPAISLYSNLGYILSPLNNNLLGIKEL